MNIRAAQCHDPWSSVYRWVQIWQKLTQNIKTAGTQKYQTRGARALIRSQKETASVLMRTQTAVGRNFCDMMRALFLAHLWVHFLTMISNYTQLPHSWKLSSQLPYFVHKATWNNNTNCTFSKRLRAKWRLNKFMQNRSAVSEGCGFRRVVFFNGTPYIETGDTWCLQ